ncbi:MAG: single-stranded DNA-binding protein [Candidatus Paceibacterota bacterium]|jgi:single-strand DNA-binding protein|nr:single-stranded DNA-binding protein [Candidatus Paceibacterota bacterium]MDD3548349.1 single-stranded DNA-binding protein [Candidatus Paceibacterota bacterium]MDD4998891.1 single-stranded DNA-binding protein [Candidatus Paceibacterota bacterium]MDD5545124.1 single-stranded DNA-binding protein [Candidatus Paceibacterota bacterium]
MNLNKVFIIGNLTRDVTLRNTPSGKSVADFGVATNRVWVDASGQKQKEAEFHNIVVWGRMAELCSQYLAKGRLVFVEGRIRTRSWIDNNGQKRIKTEILAENINFGPKKYSDEEKFKMPPEDKEMDISGKSEDISLDDLPTLEDDNDKISSDDIPF